MCGEDTTPASPERIRAEVPIRGLRASCDPCIHPLVQALNDTGHRTVASCCGHGRSPGRISLGDGRELLIAPDWETAHLLWRRWESGHGVAV